MCSDFSRYSIIERMFDLTRKRSMIDPCERAVPSEFDGEEGGIPCSKLTQLLLAAAVLEALALLAYVIVFG